MSGEEKRRTEGEVAAAGSPGGPGGDACGGVGGRRPGPRIPGGGGGYLGGCSTPKISRPRLVSSSDVRDPRLDELARMGLQRHWLNVAEAIGVDAFLVMWRVLDAEQSLWRDPPGAGLLIRLRRYESYLRFQRNRYIEALHANGLTSEQIRGSVASNIGENLSERHIDRLCKEG